MGEDDIFVKKESLEDILAKLVALDGCSMNPVTKSHFKCPQEGQGFIGWESFPCDLPTLLFDGPGPWVVI